MEYVTLMGAEDVSRAGYTMRSAASDMLRAASSISESLDQHQRFMNEWLDRFTAAINPTEGKA